jgi:BirA family biotin operon repressor/biotin-[acetyl-CoA-carboxylase] ligase
MPEGGRSTDLPPGFRLFTFDRLDSTNDEALRRIAGGKAVHGDAIMAGVQTAGRGRRGRRWQSLRGNLHLTLIVCPPPGAAVGELAFLTAAAVGEAIAGALPRSAALRYKWPNDLLLDGRKLAGLLIEAGGTEMSPALAIGIGVNVAEAPAGGTLAAASLRDAGTAITAEQLVAPVCREFAAWYDRWVVEGFAPIRVAWLARAHGVGAPVEAHLPDGSIRRGIFRGLDATGALMLEAEGGGVRAIAAGDIFFSAA